MIFVFGSNEAGIHGAGAAKVALQQHGAVWGQGFGPAGDSFAIPTKNWQISNLDLLSITHYIERFIVYARLNPKTMFKVTALGTGLAGFRHKDIARLFTNAPTNCFYDLAWKDYLPQKEFWGTF